MLKLVKCDGRHCKAIVEEEVVQTAEVAVVKVRAVLVIPRRRPSVRRCGEHRPAAIANRSQLSKYTINDIRISFLK